MDYMDDIFYSFEFACVPQGEEVRAVSETIEALLALRDEENQ